MRSGLEGKADHQIVLMNKSFAKAEEWFFVIEDFSPKDALGTREARGNSTAMRIESDDRILCWFLGVGDAGVSKCCDHAEAKSGSSFHGVDMSLER
jgi:hypothetical protein